MADSPNVLLVGGHSPLKRRSRCFESCCDGGWDPCPDAVRKMLQPWIIQFRAAGARRVLTIKPRSRRAVTARSLVVYVNAYADKLALRAVPRNVYEVFSGPALRAKLTHGFLRV